LKNNKHQEPFDLICIKKGINGLKGHRSVGGYRASMYNALKEESIDVLIEIMQQIEKENND
jgi:phosphoserine aminotransferase